MTNEGETEKNELMKAEHNYMDMNRFASTSRLHVKYPSITHLSVNLNIQ